MATSPAPNRLREIQATASAFYGLVIVLAVVFMPGGLMALGRGLGRGGWRYFLDNMRRFRL